MVLSHARGVILLAAEQRGVPVAEYSPAQVKKTIVGRGAALKPQVAYMVAQLLRLRSPPAARRRRRRRGGRAGAPDARLAAGGVLPPDERARDDRERDRRARGARRRDHRGPDRRRRGVRGDRARPASPAGCRAPGGRVSLHTELVVKEDGWALFGFDRAAERQIFQRLLGASGFGPKLALALLSALGPGAHRAQHPGARPGGAQLGRGNRPEEGGAAGAGAARPLRRRAARARSRPTARQRRGGARAHGTGLSRPARRRTRCGPRSPRGRRRRPRNSSGGRCSASPHVEEPEPR